VVQQAGLQAHVNGKKALAIAKAWCNANYELPSGKNEDDYIEHVMSEMCKMEGGSKEW
jgi:hypothetical protein